MEVGGGVAGRLQCMVDGVGWLVHDVDGVGCLVPKVDGIGWCIGWCERYAPVAADGVYRLL